MSGLGWECGLFNGLDVRIKGTDTQKLSWKREANIMNAAAVVVEGNVQPDGTLEVTQKVNLPAGRVHVTVQSIDEPVQPDRFWMMMESIWAAELVGGRTPARWRKSTARSRRCATNPRKKCRLSNVSRTNVAGPGNKPEGQRGRLADGLSDANLSPPTTPS